VGGLGLELAETGFVLSMIAVLVWQVHRSINTPHLEFLRQAVSSGAASLRLLLSIVQPQIKARCLRHRVDRDTSSPTGSCAATECLRL
jgi:hypothetical protein